MKPGEKMEINTSLSSIKAKYGFHFKEKQLSAIKSIVEGNDTFVVLPTGYGKSKIYIHLPEIFELVEKQKGTVLVTTSVVIVTRIIQSLYDTPAGRYINA
jgi:superfamily II DNA helicase RecQ